MRLHLYFFSEFNYDRDSQITIGAVTRLQVAGFGNACLSAIGKELIRASKATVDDEEDSDYSYHPPTWNTLRSNLLERGQEKLSLDIENYLSGKSFIYNDMGQK